MIAHGEVFASGAEGGEAMRVTHTPGPESTVSWSPDSTKVVYVGERNAVNHVFLYDFAKHTEKQLTNNALPDNSPRYSPDGKLIAFVRDRHELRVVDPEKKEERILVTGSSPGIPRAAHSPGRPTANGSPMQPPVEEDCATCLWSNAGGTPHQISFLANGNVNSLRWSPDGTYILYETSQRTELRKSPAST